MNPVDSAVGLCGLAALVVPGWWVARRCRLVQPWLAGGLGSVVALLNLVLLLEVAGVRLSPATVVCAWGALVIAAGVAAARLPRSRETAAVSSGALWSEHWPLLLSALPLTAAVAYRALTQPLFGIDTIFRWDFLARQMLAHGTLAFYPPVTAADYEIYAWPDGIAPAVSTLYFWLYAIAGSARPALTGPAVLGQFVLLTAAVFALGRRFSPRAGACAVALLGCSPLVGWATAMGQETGLTALALSGLLLYLPRNRAEESPAAVITAGLAAATGSLAREYGLALIVLGVGLCLRRGLSRRTTVYFFLVAAAAAFPWYARNWLRTGNPLFDLGLGGLFPVNEVHAALNACYQTAFGWSHLPPEAPRLLLVNGAVGLLALLAGAWWGRRSARALLTGAALFVLIWIASLGYTAAGFTSSLRVLSPALALGAVLGGAVLARWIPDRRHLAGVSAGLLLLAVDAALRTLTLPAQVYGLSPGRWLTVGGAVHDYHARPIYGEIARVAGPAKLLVLGPNALLTRHGARTVPLWSPAVRFLFAAPLAPAEVARRLRAAGIGFVLLNTGPVNECFLVHSAFFRDPGGMLIPVWSDGDMVLHRVADPPPP